MEGNMDWLELFNGFNEDITFFDPIADDELNKIKEATGTEVSGDLLNLLLQTNGIKDNRFGDYLVYDSDRIIEHYKLCLDYFKPSKFAYSRPLLFFADDGCGNYFGYEVKGNQIISPQIIFFSPIEPDKLRIVASDFSTWATEWYTGKLSV